MTFISSGSAFKAADFDRDMPAIRTPAPDEEPMKSNHRKYSMLARTTHRAAGLVFGCLNLCAILAVIGTASGSPAFAQTCDVDPVPMPAGFPDQPINIFIPRSTASGSLPLSDEIAKAIRNLKDADGNDLNIEVNLLFKFGGNLEVALEYFSELPPNGYNVVQLNDTYASLLATSPDQEVFLRPLNIAQITFSQLYIRTDDTRFSDLDGFVDHASSGDTSTLKIAIFGGDDTGLGLEDFLLEKFEQAFLIPLDATAEAPVIEDVSTTANDPATPPAFVPQAYESGSERYFSLFNKTDSKDGYADALIEQPGDIARLIEGGFLKPIFTLLPKEDVTQALTTRLGPTTSFATPDREQCHAYYRFRGFFVQQNIPPERRQFLDWLFQQAFNSESFQKFNRTHYMDVLYTNPDIISSYCSRKQAEAFFFDSISHFKECLDAASPDNTR